jgi:hypothetical protein
MVMVEIFLHPRHMAHMVEVLEVWEVQRLANLFMLQVGAALADIMVRVALVVLMVTTV